MNISSLNNPFSGINPDYTAGVSLNITVGVETTIAKKGWVICGLEAYNNTQGVFSVNGQNYRISQSNGSTWSCFGSIMVPVDIGDVVKVVSRTSAAHNFMTFYPYK